MPVCFIRTIDNKTIADVDCTEKDIHCVINILYYTEELIRQNLNLEFMQDMYFVSEIRGTFWEQVGQNKKTPFQLGREICSAMANKWGLLYVED